LKKKAHNTHPKNQNKIPREISEKRMGKDWKKTGKRLEKDWKSQLQLVFRDFLLFFYKPSIDRMMD
jgi:hypothetical protein